MYYTFCNEVYARWLTVLVHSLRRVDRSTPIMVHFIGGAASVERDLAGLGGITIEAPRILPPPSTSLPDLLQIRAENALLVARKYKYDWLMVLDADLLVRRPLTRLVKAMALYDFGAVIRGSANGEELPPHLQVSAALYILTKHGLPVLERAVELMSSNCHLRGIHRGEWYWEQACLAESVLTSDLRIRTIPREIYLSSRPYDPRATVWNGNFSGERKQAALKLFEAELKHLAGRSHQ
ncbi:MAG: hypothetical protein ACJ76Y_14895 [Thermoanaerobaculia bacterium]